MGTPPAPSVGGGSIPGGGVPIGAGVGAGAAGGGVVAAGKGEPPSDGGEAPMVLPHIHSVQSPFHLWIGGCVERAQPRNRRIKQ